MKTLFRQLQYSVIISFIALAGCKSKINLLLPDYQPQIVVEGYIENGQMPVVQLTKSAPYFQPYSLDSFYNSYVHNALVVVSDGSIRDTLKEFDPTPYIKGVMKDSLRFYAYADANLLSPKLTGVAGKTYTLDIYISGNHLSSITTINSIPKIDSIWTGLPLASNDTSRRVVFMNVQDPATPANYYKFYNCKNIKLSGLPPLDNYFLVPRNAKNTGEFGDAYFTGKVFTFRGSAGYHRKDTAYIKFSHIDLPQYNYWTSVNQSSSSQGSPFSSPAYIVSNIKGGIGIWAGMGSVYRQVIIKK